MPKLSKRAFLGPGNSPDEVASVVSETVADGKHCGEHILLSSPSGLHDVNRYR